MQKKILIIVIMLLIASTIYADGTGRITITDRKIIERLARLETKVEEGQKYLQGLMWVILAGIVSLIGFVIWDRRTALSPVVKKTKELEKTDEKLLDALREYAKVTPKLASILRSFGLL